jgi:peptide/nickel transport system substrate-binding protein
MKTWFTLFLSFVVLSLVLAGCSSPASPIVSSPAAPAKTSAPAPATTAPAATSAAPKPSVSTSASTPVAATPRYGGDMKIILTGSVSAIGVLGAVTEYSAGSMYQRTALPVMETLFSYDANEKFLPKLAESWDSSPDGKILTLHLRKGVKFSDGTTFNAQALKDDFDIMKAAKNVPNWPTVFGNVASYEVADEYTLKINFSKYDSLFMVNMSLYTIMSPTAMKIPTTPQNQAKDHMIGTGPFLFNSYSNGEFIKYTKNPNYWQKGKPYVDTIEEKEIDDPVTAMMYFKAGNAQLIFGITPVNGEELQKLGYKVLKSSSTAILPIIPDGANKDSPFANIKVRQALEYAIDRNDLASIGKGFWVPAFQMAVPTDSRYIPDLAPRKYDPAKAKQLLAEAGYPNGFQTTLVANSTFKKDVLVAIQAYLKAVGIDGTIDLQEAAKFADSQNKGWKGILFSGIPIVGNVQSMWNRFGGYTVPSMYRNTFQQKLDAAISEPDYDKRLNYLKDMVRVLNDDAMVCPLFGNPDLSAIDNTVQGDFKWEIGHPNMWEPADLWLTK